LELAAGGCGTLDVADVNAAATVVIESGLCSSDAVVAFGGSHGGFLTAHLSAQFPERYKVTVIRNPVIDIASMVGSSDIPDWCWTESGGQYDPAVAPSGETLARMHAVSPLARVSAVRAPSLVLIGLKDLRVPVPQGFLWHNALRARGVATEVRTYPDDCHPLGSVKAAADTFVQSVTWMRRHLPSQ
jgi:acylaminoacyl-peptidase